MALNALHVDCLVSARVDVVEALASQAKLISDYSGTDRKVSVTGCNAPINYLPHYPPLRLYVGKVGGFSSVLNKILAPRVGNLTLSLK